MSSGREVVLQIKAGLLYDKTASPFLASLSRLWKDCDTTVECAVLESMRASSVRRR